MTSKIFKPFAVMAAIAILWSPAKAQNSQGESVVSLNVGYSLAINLVKTGLDQFDNVETSSTPAIGLTFDHSLSDLFSLGLAVSHQSLSADFTNTYFDQNNVEQTETATFKSSRISIGMRPLLHYGGTDKLDLYSGLRVGYLMFNQTTESDDPDVDNLIDIKGSRVHVGLVLFGMRYYFTDNIGFNFDTQLGAPYLASVGFSAKF